MLEKPEGRKKLFIISVVFHQIPAGQNVGEVSGLLQCVWKLRTDKENLLLYSNLLKSPETC